MLRTRPPLNSRRFGDRPRVPQKVHYLIYKFRTGPREVGEQFAVQIGADGAPAIGKRMNELRGIFSSIVSKQVPQGTNAGIFLYVRTLITLRVCFGCPMASGQIFRRAHIGTV